MGLDKGRETLGNFSKIREITIVLLKYIRKSAYLRVSDHTVKHK